LPWQRSLKDRKTNFGSIIYSHSSTNPKNLAKFGKVDFEIIDETEIVKMTVKQETAGEHIARRALFNFLRLCLGQ